MEKSTKVQDKSYPILGVEKEVEEPYNEEVWVQSRLEARVILHGVVTGKRYEFARAGAKTLVDKRDANEILNKKRGRACCGGTASAPLFEIVENI